MPLRRAWIEERLARYFEDRPGDVAAVYLFGSVARGTAGPGSDVDVRVLLGSAPPPTLEALPFDVEADLERELGVPVQVVLLNAASPDLVHRVLRDGRLLVDRDPSARIRFEVRLGEPRSNRELFQLRARAGVSGKCWSTISTTCWSSSRLSARFLPGS